MVKLDQPYIAGYLGFREVPHMARALARCEEEAGLLADVVLVDGNGTLHPRGFGSACHLGSRALLPICGTAPPRGRGSRRWLTAARDRPRRSPLSPGVVTGRPTVGVAKNFLCVDGLTREDARALAARSTQEPVEGRSGARLGFAFRTHAEQKRAVFVSTGHRVSHDLAARVVAACSKHKVPEPIRYADHLSREALRALP